MSERHPSQIAPGGHEPPNHAPNAACRGGATNNAAQRRPSAIGFGGWGAGCGSLLTLTLSLVSAHALASPHSSGRASAEKPGVALAEPAQAAADKTASGAPGAGPTCVITGSTSPPKDLELYDSEADGSVIARLTGVETPLKAFEFPAKANARARLETGTGKGHFRVEGFVHAKRLPLFTRKTVPVVTGHIWIGAAREVHFNGSRSKQLRITKHLTTPLSQSFKAWTSCTNLSFDQGTPPGWSIDGDARGYRMRKDSIVLYDDYGREKNDVVTLQRAAGAEMLFWSTKRHGNFVQVAYEGEILLEAWAKASELKALPRGEVMDQAIPPRRKVTGSKVQIQGEAKLIKTTREHYIFTEAKDDAKKIGRIEVDTETYVLDVVAGWASVMPKNATVMPAEGAQFWVKAADLGLTPTPSNPGPAGDSAE